MAFSLEESGHHPRTLPRSATPCGGLWQSVPQREISYGAEIDASFNLAIEIVLGEEIIKRIRPMWQEVPSLATQHAAPASQLQSIRYRLMFGF